MNEQPQTINQTSITAVDLERDGFSPTEIQKLVAMRDRYHPLIEQVESHRQWEQIQFLRWLYRNGVYPRG